MTSDQLAVQIVVSDPWEFTTEAGDNVFTGSVRLASSDEGVWMSVDGRCFLN